MLILHDFSTSPSGPCAIALGAFDGVHAGHRAVIEAAVRASHTEGLTPAVFTFSELPKLALTGAKSVFPLCSFEEKAELIAGLGVELMWAPPASPELLSTPAEEFVRGILIGRLRAAHVFCGEDHRFGKGGLGDAALLRSVLSEYGVKLTVAAPVVLNGEKVSSTRIRRLLTEGRIDEARALGYRI